MVEDESSNTLCTGRVIHTPTIPGLITKTYMPLKHCQTFTFLTPLRLDDQQYKEALEILKRILIPSSLWPLTPTTTAPAYSEYFKPSTVTQSVYTFSTKLVTSAPLNKSSLYPHSHLSQCPTLPLQFSSHPTPHLPLTALATPLTLSPLPLLKAQLIQRWLCPTNK